MIELQLKISGEDYLMFVTVVLERGYAKKLINS